MAKYCFGVDVGGTTVKLGCFDTEGTLLEKWEITTRTANGGEAILPDVAASILDKMKEREISREDVIGVGVGAPGPIDGEGTVYNAVNLGWGTFSIKNQLQGLLNIPVEAGNDANVAALGEMWKGGGQGHKNLVAVTLGTGVGGGIIADGRILSGATGAAGEIGHIHVMDGEQEMCNCGNYGCLEQFKRFFDSYQFKSVIVNTLKISLSNLIFGFPIPILLALMINQLNFGKLKKILQTATYAPHFISIPAVVGMIVIMLSPGGLIYNIINRLTGERAGIPMGNADLFCPIFVITEIWQHAGWDAIIYIASLTSVSPDLYEAAEIDGAGKLQKIRYIDIPSILPTAVVLLIMNSGRIMSVGFEKVLLMQNPMNISASEIISTYVYKIGLIGMEYSYSAAIGLFNSVINLVLILVVNGVAKRAGNISLL